MTTLGQGVRAAAGALSGASVDSPRLTAETLLMFVLGCERAYLLGHPERPLSPEEQSRFEAAIEQRASGMPTQYITGHQEFWGLDLVVSPAVLIPRPETEHVVEAVLELARILPAPRIVDVGTGSGCIALALAKELPGAEIHAVDISAAALEVARANAARLGFLERIRFSESDLLGAFSGEAGKFDFVVSNPPYIGWMERDALQHEVRDFEPECALFGGEKGLEVIECLIPQALRALKPRGWLIVEIGKGQEAGLLELLDEWNETVVTPDLQGILRVAAAQRA